MSYERAKINCERCYNLAKEEFSNTSTTKRNFQNILKNESLWTARNEALKALEGESIIWRQTHFEPARKECVKCDYSKPSIKNYIDKNVDTKDSE